MSLFRLGDFQLHSGAKSSWKIDCDALTDSDICALGFMMSEILPPFYDVYGIPSGGKRIAKELWTYHRSPTGRMLIVDDVFTTGASMEAARKQFPGAIGAVIFSRGKCPEWITPLFQVRGMR